MRRAIFRTTLESSTTRQVFIFGLLLDERRMPIGLRCECCFGHDFEDAIDVEDDHELAVEAVDAAGELGHAGIEIDGVFLAAVIGELRAPRRSGRSGGRRIRRAGRRRPPSAACRRRSWAGPSRARMSTTVTMRPRRLSTPAISADDSGTRVSRSGMNTSCTREIGRPNNCPPITAVTYSATVPSMVSVLVVMVLRSLCPANSFMPLAWSRRSVPSAPRSGRDGRTWRRNRGSRPAARARSPPATPSRTAR